MSESFELRRFVRHWPLLIAGAVWLLFVAGFLHSHIVRAAVAVGGIALMLYQWQAYRKSNRGSQLVFLSLIVSGFGLAFFLLAVNVARFYTYDPESERMWEWHTRVARVQDALMWVVGALVVIVAVWALFQLVHWLGKQVSGLRTRP